MGDEHNHCFIIVNAYRFLAVRCAHLRNKKKLTIFVNKEGHKHAKEFYNKFFNEILLLSRYIPKRIL